MCVRPADVPLQSSQVPMGGGRMNVLTVNCGSSSLKIGVSAVDGANVTPVMDASAEAIGGEAVVRVRTPAGAASRTSQPLADHAAALETLLALSGHDAVRSIDAVGHRVVQGGAFVQPTTIDRAVIQSIEQGRRLAPLHNGPSLDGIRAAQRCLPGVPMVAVFDTAFHTTMPSQATQYALPRRLTLKYGLRRYGYHGIAHQSLAERYAELSGTPHDDVSIITLQLGNGCSATAIAGGVSVDTSMGFTPLEGLIMGTRPGDVDPGALSFLLREAGITPDDLDRLLNQESGLLGLSGTSGDMARLLEEEAQGHPRAHDAITMFCYRVRTYIGAYTAVLGRVQAVVFGGGIGERSADIRQRICGPLAPLGLVIDPEQNAALAGDGRFSRDDSAVTAWVIGTDEERIIARDTYHVLTNDVLTQPRRLEGYQ